jgi:hypothetical protein
MVLFTTSVKPRFRCLPGRSTVRNEASVKKSFISGALALLLMTSGVAVAGQLTADQKIDRVGKLLKSLETKDPTSLAYVDSKRYTQHNLAVEDGPRGVRSCILRREPPFIQ